MGWVWGGGLAGDARTVAGLMMTTGILAKPAGLTLQFVVISQPAAVVGLLL